jgi:ectoine hydroxylase-related dioxygenase (phytanoyl-CoA dioxygenase family)
MSKPPVTDKDIETYETDGFIRFEHFFTPEETATLRAAIDDAISQNRERIVGAAAGGRGSDDYEKVFNQMVNLWTDYPEVKAFSFNERLADTARQLSKAGNVRIYHDHAMIKPGGEESKPTNWHQDQPYWPMDPLGPLSAWIAVDDVTVENGCLHFCPGSHKFGLQEGIKLDVAGESIVTKMRDRGHPVADPVPMEMAAGGVTFHHGCNFHYAGPNQTDQPRRAFAVIYIPDYVTFTGGKEAAGAQDEMKKGAPWDHPLHPVLAPIA